MPYAVITYDRPDTVAIRDRYRADHIAYLEQFQHMLISSGGLMTDDEVVFGGCIILDCDDRAFVDEFVANDPFTKADLFATTLVAKVRKGFFNFGRWY